MASVRKREWTHNGETKTAWVCEYTDGKGKRHRKTFEKKKDADAYRTRMEVEKTDGFSAHSSLTVKDLAGLFLKHLEDKVKDNRIGLNHLRVHKQGVTVCILPYFGKMKVSDVKFSDVEAFKSFIIKSRNYSARSVKTRLSTLRAMEEFAKKRGMVKGQVISEACRELSPVGCGKIETFTPEQVQTLLTVSSKLYSGCSPRVRDMMECFVNISAFCGLRLGEIMGLTVKNIDINKRIIHVRHSLTDFDLLKAPKTKSGIRDVPMPVRVRDLLRSWIEQHYVENERGLIFRNETGTQVRQQNFHKWYWPRLLERAGLRVRGQKNLHFHALRHFAASWMVEHGLPLPEVAALLGHSKFDMTLQIYVHPIVNGSRRHEAIDRAAGALLALTDATNSRHG
ncbi:tyrosine-type recombinase/integrase [Azospirillum brasilense]|uniref:tyrosine-type recombinase/integrase n=1 Tax=Azospirillum brasilense TaxID=192 RepID=UPI001EDC5088|nr:site-specific integrase [Azospirillum brasilense]UKJ74504.1 site-specific integrase [Azospirillum brasilense]